MSDVFLTPTVTIYAMAFDAAGKVTARRAAKVALAPNGDVTVVEVQHEKGEAVDLSDHIRLTGATVDQGSRPDF